MDKQSPRTRSELFIKKANSLKTPIVRKTLIFHNALIDDLRKIRQCDQKKLLNLASLDILKNKALDTMLAHTYRIYHQYKTIKSLKDNLPEDHCIMHFDYSENWSCNYSKEITYVQQQATLHDGLIYTNNEPTSFCTVSDSPVHDANAVFAHLRPVITYVKKEHPNIKHIHCVTVSPSSQYRNKTMFYLMGVIQQQFCLKITWNYLESGHGKGQRMALVQPLAIKYWHFYFRTCKRDNG